MSEFFGNQITAGVLSAIEFSRRMSNGDQLFVGGISFFTEPYIANYNNCDTKVIESVRKRILENEENFVHSSKADRAAFEKYVLPTHGLILDPWLTSQYPNYKINKQ
jgi:hypothetical protein